MPGPAAPKGGDRETERRYILFALRVAGEFGAVIAVPVVLLALAGKWLDARYGTGPLFLIAGFALAAVISAVSIVRKAKTFAKEYEAIESKKVKE